MNEDKNKDEESPSGSPAASPMPAAQAFPTCSGCKTPVEKIRYLDYSEVRLVYHDVAEQCVLGVISAI